VLVAAALCAKLGEDITETLEYVPMTGSPTPCTIGRAPPCSTTPKAGPSMPLCAAAVIAMAVPCDPSLIASSVVACAMLKNGTLFNPSLEAQNASC
jgi:hypothetical protein